jgi:hypothetical protein
VRPDGHGHRRRHDDDEHHNDDAYDHLERSVGRDRLVRSNGPHVVRFLRRRRRGWRRHRPKPAERQLVYDDHELERSDGHDDHAKLVRSDRFHVVRSDRHDHERDHDHRWGHRHRPDHAHDRDQDDDNDHDKDLDGSHGHDHHAEWLRSARHAPVDELVR